MKTNSTIKIGLFISLLLILTTLKTQVFAATFVVDNLADTDNALGYTISDGTNTLRKCMRLANANANTPIIDVINFAAGLTGGITITLTAALPFIADPLLIDGFTANGYVAPTPRVSILGGANPNAFNVAPGGNNSTLRGFAISNTSADGIYINGATNVTIAGCWIGLLANGTLPGTTAAKVGGHGIYMTGSSNNSIIGIATVAGKNVISGCLGHGIVVVNSSSIILKNNYVGTNTNGTAALANGVHGINIDNSPATTIGGSAANESNLISGNTSMGLIILNLSANTIIKGNIIGTNLAGIAALANGVHGINIDNSTNAIIGGNLAGEGNLISGNTQSGLVITNASSNAVVKGNKIGTDITGTSAVGNGVHGISIYTNVLGTTIGGGTTGDKNLISANGQNGIDNTSASHNTIILGNFIGTDITGMTALGNKTHGVYLNASNGATIGGNTKLKRNIISGNGTGQGMNGIGITNCNGHTIQGNFLGTNVNGLAALPNFDTGISMTNSSGNTIGGASLMQRNVSSGNGKNFIAPYDGNFGIYFFNVDNTTITGNYIGTDSTGNAPLANACHGIHTDGGCDLNAWTGNLVSGNGSAITGLGNGFNLLSSTNNTFYGNYIGLGLNGTSSVGNHVIGFRFGSSSTGNTVGGSSAGQRNYMSGNGNHGIMFDGQSSGNTVKNNYVGCDITGLVAVPNQTVGLLLLDGSSNTIVGGASANEGNIFCCSAAGTGIQSQISSNHIIYGNLIGVDKNGTLTSGFGNFQSGVWLMSYQYLSWADNNNVVGGLSAGQANIIANNGADGVRVSGYSANAIYNPIIGNKIYCNGALGINMENNNSFENEGITAPTVTSSTANTISGTATTGNTIHVYRNQYSDGARCDCEGEIYVGTTTVAGGTWSLTHSLGLTPAQALSVTATQTNPTNSTSEFWVCSVPLPVDLLSLEAKKINTIVSISFTVSNENNINLYRVLKSKDGINFEIIGSVIPVNGPGIHAYSFDDLYPSEGINYYRIQTVENDGRIVNSKIVYVNTNSVNTYLYPNPATEEVTVRASDIISRIELHNSLGQLAYEKDIDAPELIIPLTNLATGVYYVKVYEGSTIGVYKLEKK